MRRCRWSPHGGSATPGAARRFWDGQLVGLTLGGVGAVGRTDDAKSEANSQNKLALSGVQDSFAS